MAIQQHPIPQNVTAYQFRLVGDMTVKQFFQIGGGIAIGLFFYATKLPFFFKWPIIGLSVGLGAGMAFLPVEGRPLDQWLLAFFKSIYAPTIYTWKKPGEDSTTPVQPVRQPTTLKPIAQTQAATNDITLPGNLTSGTRPQADVNKPKVNISTPPVHGFTIPKPLPPLNIQAQPKTPTPQVATAPTGSAPVNADKVALPNMSARTHNGGVQPVFSQTLPIPSTPQTPNTIVGMTLTPDGHILESAIVEIKLQGATVRATKSNKLGQFLFAQPLNSGNYQITAEKEGFKFPIFALNLSNQVVSPLKLQAIATISVQPADNYSTNQASSYAR